MAVRLIISDVDGCISPEESVAWDFDMFAAFCRQVREASAGRGTLAPMTLCTGRPQPYVEALMKVMDIRYPAICENGAVLYDLATNEASYAPGVTTEKVTGLRAIRCFIEDEILPKCPKAVMQFGKEAQLSVFSHDPSVLPPIGQRVREYIDAGHGTRVHINCSHFYLNISLDALDKGSAIRHLLTGLGLKRDEVAGIGDTIGDMPLRNEVGFFACPSNATAEIRKVADYCSEKPNIAGLLEILKHPRLQRAR